MKMPQATERVGRSVSKKALHTHTGLKSDLCLNEKTRIWYLNTAAVVTARRVYILFQQPESQGVRLHMLSSEHWLQSLRCISVVGLRRVTDWLNY